MLYIMIVDKGLRHSSWGVTAQIHRKQEQRGQRRIPKAAVAAVMVLWQADEPGRAVDEVSMRAGCSLLCPVGDDRNAFSFPPICNVGRADGESADQWRPSA